MRKTLSGLGNTLFILGIMAHNNWKRELTSEKEVDEKCKLSWIMEFGENFKQAFGLCSYLIIRCDNLLKSDDQVNNKPQQKLRWTW